MGVGYQLTHGSNSGMYQEGHGFVDGNCSKGGYYSMERAIFILIKDFYPKIFGQSSRGWCVTK